MDPQAAPHQGARADHEQQAQAQNGPGSSREDEGPREGAGQDRDAVAALEDRLRRALADLDNLRKRYARELERQRAAEANRMAGAWLPVLDNLDLALSHVEADPSTIIEGVRAVREQALAVLANLGFSRQDEVGVPFDPTRHEVVNVVDDSEAEPGTVVRVLRPGYGTPERQLRPGAVTVAGRRS
ncbi:MAG TPA: nucleotide exchange factor GrpE [Pseudonocardiaceae bacterium]|jgi:molecular chaperone GrpE|nr:nucleotide exchange factor GrpE [Pseudonocardiaceae bacterium]